MKELTYVSTYCHAYTKSGIKIAWKEACGKLTVWVHDDDRGSADHTEDLTNVRRFHLFILCKNQQCSDVSEQQY